MVFWQLIISAELDERWHAKDDLSGNDCQHHDSDLFCICSNKSGSVELKMELAFPFSVFQLIMFRAFSIHNSPETYEATLATLSDSEYSERFGDESDRTCARRWVMQRVAVLS